MRRLLSSAAKSSALIKRLVHQSKKRGTSENGILLGNFAEAHVAQMSESKLNEYSELISENDIDLFAWLSGALPTPDKYKCSPVFSCLVQFTDEHKRRVCLANVSNKGSNVV